MARVLVLGGPTVDRVRLCARLARCGVTAVGEASTEHLPTVLADFAPDAAIVELDPLADPQLLPSLTTRSDVTVLAVVPPDTPPRGRIAAFRAGAQDVITASSDADEIITRTLTLLDIRPTRHHVVELDDMVLDERSHLAWRNGCVLDLTATEFKLLSVLVRDAGVVISKPQLLDAVWGFDGFDVNLVEVHISALRRKLEVHGPRVVHTVRSLGYVARARPSIRHVPQTGNATLPRAAVTVASSTGPATQL